MNIGRRTERGLKVLGFLVVILIVGYFIMSFFYRLPDISSRRQSYMIDDGEATTLGQKVGSTDGCPS